MRTTLLLCGLTLAAPALALTGLGPLPGQGPTPSASPLPALTPGGPHALSRSAAAGTKPFRRARHDLHLTPEPTLSRPQPMADATPRPGSGPLP